MQGNELWVIMPVYNEEACVKRVLDEWLPILRKTVKNFTVLAINDGSKDRSVLILEECSKIYPELEILDKANSGHGQSCIQGYRLAISRGAEWILQIDSDGQCDALYFGQFWEARQTSPVILGFRYKREDGWKRYAISRVVSLFAWAATRVWVKDANVPFRLMRKDRLEAILTHIPESIYLANILVSVLLKKTSKIFWLPIIFRNRIGGTPSIKTYSFAKQGYKLFVQLSEALKQIR